MRAVCWQDHCSLGFEKAPILVLDTYGNSADDFVPFVADSLVSGIFEEDKDWNLGNVPLSKNADVHESLPVDLI